MLNYLGTVWSLVIFRHFRLVSTIARRKRSTKPSVILLWDSKHSHCISACSMRSVWVFHSVQLKIKDARTGLESWPKTDTKPGYHWNYQPHTRPKFELQNFSSPFGMCSKKLACRGMRSFDVDFVIACRDWMWMRQAAWLRWRQLEREGPMISSQGTHFLHHFQHQAAWLGWS